MNGSKRRKTNFTKFTPAAGSSSPVRKKTTISANSNVISINQSPDSKMVANRKETNQNGEGVDVAKLKQSGSSIENLVGSTSGLSSKKDAFKPLTPRQSQIGSVKIDSVSQFANIFWHFVHIV